MQEISWLKFGDYFSLKIELDGNGANYFLAETHQDSRVFNEAVTQLKELGFEKDPEGRWLAPMTWELADQLKQLVYAEPIIIHSKDIRHDSNDKIPRSQSAKDQTGQVRPNGNEPLEEVSADAISGSEGVGEASGETSGSRKSGDIRNIKVAGFGASRSDSDGDAGAELGLYEEHASHEYEPQNRRGASAASPDFPGTGEREGGSGGNGGSERRIDDSEIVDKNPRHFFISDEIDRAGGFSPAQRFQENMEAIRILKQITESSNPATTEQKSLLARYNGWGGLATAFQTYNSFNDPEWVKNGRQLLRELLDSKEYEQAESSINNAHFTSPEVIREIWRVIEEAGFSGGKILEPACGSGNFIGLMPNNLVRNSLITAVEKDGITGRIAKELYPDAKIFIKGYEEIAIPNNQFDLVVTNVPFGDYSVYDPDYQAQNMPIHDYFIVKSLNALKPGGIGVFITSSHTLNKINSKARMLMHEKAVLAGAIRLPDHAQKAQAGVEVTTDILFFVGRESAPKVGELPEWVKAENKTFLNEQKYYQDEEVFSVNRYFLDNPTHILGKEVVKRGERGRYLLAVENEKSLSELIAGAITQTNIPFDLKMAVQKESPLIDYSMPIKEGGQPLVQEIIHDFGHRHIGSFIEKDGDVYEVIGESENEQGENFLSLKQYDITGKRKQRLLGMIAIRNEMDKVFQTQIDDPDNDAINEEARALLNQVYDTFVNRLGPINSPANRRLFVQDPEAGRVFALENYDDEKDVATKADVFYQKVIAGQAFPDFAETESDALLLSLAKFGKPVLPYMVDLFNVFHQSGKTLKTHSVASMKTYLIDEGLCFYDPVKNELVTAAEYLSGNVRKKLGEALAIEELDGGFQHNIQALKKVMPKDLQPSDIEIKAGDSWIPAHVIESFLAKRFKLKNIHSDGPQVHFRKLDGRWIFDVDKHDIPSDIKNFEFGTDRRDAHDLVNRVFNHEKVDVYDTVDVNGNKQRVLNIDASIAANEKADAIREAFKHFLWDDPEITQELVTIYNERFNSYIPPNYDGSHLTFPGMSAAIQLRPHQKNAIWRAIMDGNILLAHEVGCGKTFCMIAICMEMNRLGKTNKPILVVKNHMLEQIERESRQLYPTAKLLVVGQNDFSQKNRASFMGKAANNSWDIVIITHSMFEKLSVGKDFEKAVIEDELFEYKGELEAIKESGGARYSLKQIQSKIKSMEAKLKTISRPDYKDTGIDMNELGIDFIGVDESHAFKNLMVNTSSSSEISAGITGSARAFDLYTKTKWLYEKRGGASGLLFATGTPISNTVFELFNLQRYLQPDRLAEAGLETIGAWSMFLEPKKQYEPDPSGKYRLRTRYSLCNLPELMSMLLEKMDVVFAADVGELNLPKSTTINVVAEMTPIQQEVMSDLSERVEKIRSRSVRADEDNLLKIISDGRKMSLDARLLDSMFEDDEGTKVSIMTRNIATEYEKSQDRKGAQLVFCDMGTPGAGKEFVLYDDIKTKLISQGIPEKEIAYVHDAGNDAARAKLFEGVRSGAVRVLIGSTFKMGEGTNVQDRICAMHDLDAPWRPSDIVQRGGRMIRHGNIFVDTGVSRYIYTTEGSFDLFIWTTLKAKEESFSKVMKGDPSVRKLDLEIDPTYAETVAITTNDPLIKEKIEAEQEVSKYESLYRSWRNQRYSINNNISYTKDCIVRMQSDLSKYNAINPLDASKLNQDHYRDSWSIDMSQYGFDSEFYGERAKMLPILKKIAESQKLQELDHICFANIPVKVIFDIKKNKTQARWIIGEGENSIICSRAAEIEDLLIAKETKQKYLIKQISDQIEELNLLERQAEVPFDNQGELEAALARKKK
nr:SNF2-related protein [Methylomarinum sp. Ch1-1]MDP4523165.1 SNF2-related protein [Methylomarinum sp. Ch1-1]